MPYKLLNSSARICAAVVLNVLILTAWACLSMHLSAWAHMGTTA